MRNRKKDFESKMTEAFRLAATEEQKKYLSPEECRNIYGTPGKMVLVPKEEKRKNAVRRFFERITIPKPIKALAMLFCVIFAFQCLSSGIQQKSVSEHGYTVIENYYDYLYYYSNIKISCPLLRDKYFQAKGPIQNKYVVTYVPESLPVTHFSWIDWLNYHTAYYFCEEVGEPGEPVTEVSVFIYPNGTHIEGSPKKYFEMPEIVQFPNGEYGVIMKNKDSDEISSLFWSNGEISVCLYNWGVPNEELFKIIDSIKPIYDIEEKTVID